MRYGRVVSAAAVSVFALMAGGCHRKTTRAYQPPPPPATRTAANRTGGSARPVHPDSGDTTGSIPSPTPIPNSFGKPVSTEIGLASWYGPPYAGRKGADGTVYNQNAMTAAHLTLPMGTMVRVTNLTNNESAVVKITDRGPFVRGRIIDLSLAAAKATGVYRAGVAKVKVEAFAAPARANADPGGRWCVQIGAFAHESDAVKLKQDLLRRYTTAKVIEFPGPTGYWVRVNPKFPDKRNATEVADGIHPKDPAAEPYLIRTD
ncbi:MAG TPA: septal ring lytic transglycosylase RlpA family protein [Edaphobacter sp.]|nr:septal ring lytic transglycosylase RlpA family protein [Edaphobacter sp.]